MSYWLVHTEVYVFENVLLSCWLIRPYIHVFKSGYVCSIVHAEVYVFQNVDVCWFVHREVYTGQNVDVCSPLHAEVYVCQNVCWFVHREVYAGQNVDVCSFIHTRIMHHLYTLVNISTKLLILGLLSCFGRFIHPSHYFHNVWAAMCKYIHLYVSMIVCVRVIYSSYGRGLSFLL